jgi:hypothetical protein
MTLKITEPSKRLILRATGFTSLPPARVETIMSTGVVHFKNSGWRRRLPGNRFSRNLQEFGNPRCH